MPITPEREIEIEQELARIEREIDREIAHNRKRSLNGRWSESRLRRRRICYPATKTSTDVLVILSSVTAATIDPRWLVPALVFQCRLLDSGRPVDSFSWPENDSPAVVSESLRANSVEGDFALACCRHALAGIWL